MGRNRYCGGKNKIFRFIEVKTVVSSSSSADKYATDRYRPEENVHYQKLKEIV